MKYSYIHFYKNAILASGFFTLLLSLLLLSNTSALTYQSEHDVSFTINPMISVDLSSSDLIISDLTPGTAADSNIVTVTVSTNASHGYYLAATAGTSSGDTYLTNTQDSNYKFTNLSSNVATLSSFTNNTWGYSYSTDNGSTWISGSQGSTSTGYNGLPLDNDDNGATGVTLVDTTNPVAGSSVKFKIAAKSADTQAAGTYTNTVNFYAVTNPAPMTFDDAYAAAGKTKTNGYYTMQDATSSICSAVYTGAVGRVIDTRDNETYKIAKLADNKCWMVENLNLAGGTALSADNTDVDASYISSFSTSNDLTKSGNSIVIPTSVKGNFNNPNYSYVYNSGNKENCGTSGQNTPCYSYYSWDVATLGSARSISTVNTDASYSICPKGWKLPTAYTTSATNWQTTSDFYALAHQYGLDSTTSTSESDNGFYTQAGPGTTPNFLLAGYYTGSANGSVISGGSRGYYWSSTSSSRVYEANQLFFYASEVNSVDPDDRAFGFSIRCLIK